MTALDTSKPIGQELRPLLLWASLLRHWRLTVVLPFFTTLVVLVLVFVLPQRYTSEASFRAQGRSDSRLPSNLASIAGQLGISTGDASAASPKFYADLLKSRGVMDTVINRHLGEAYSPDPAIRLRDWLGEGGASPADSVYAAEQYLGDRIQTTLDRETGVVNLRVTLRDPRVAAKVASDLLGEIDRFNTSTRQSQAKTRREFVGGRLHETEGELRNAEEELTRFYESNRNFQNSPSLVFQERRLQARVDLQRDLVLTLRREWETARIEEVNDTPVLTIIDQPHVPARRSWPRRRVALLSAGALSLAIGISLALIVDSLGNLAAIDSEGRNAARDEWRRLRVVLGRTSHVSGGRTT